MSSLPWYYVPRDGPLSSYREFVRMLPAVDHPEAFGQHTNADIIAQIQETRRMFETLMLLAPQASASGSKPAAGGDAQAAKVETRESKVLELADSIRKQVPENIDYETIAGILAPDMNPLNVVFLQEVPHELSGLISAPEAYASMHIV